MLTKSRAGFTLIELMVSVAIAGILASIAIPNFKRYKYKVMEVEVYTQLPELANSLEAWYHTEHCAAGMDDFPFGAWGALAGYAPGSCVSHCITNWGAVPPPPGGPAGLSSKPYVIDWSAYPSGVPFGGARDIGFMPADPLRYWYVVFSSGSGFSDIDGDGDIDLDPLDDNCGNFDDHEYLLIAAGDIDDDDEVAWHGMGMKTVDGNMVRGPVRLNVIAEIIGEDPVEEH